jgi:hypothetical protein
MVVVSNRIGTASSQDATLTVTQATPTLIFASIPAKTYGDAAFSISASSVSPGAITYSVVSGPATISGSTVTITGVGTVSLQAAQAATTNYTAASATTSFTVNQETPTLAFTSIAAKTYGDAAFSVSASSVSSGAITYSVVSGPATISGNSITITGAGTVSLQAAQAATINYTAATAATSFMVSQEAPTLTFALIPTRTYGDAAFTVSANSASTGAITYSVVSGPATTSGSTVTITGAGTVRLQAAQAATTNYTAATATTSFAVSQATPTLTFTSIPAKTYGDAAFSVSASSASTGVIAYSVVSGPATINGDTISITGAGMVNLQASQAATSNYTAATAATSFTVSQEAPTLTFALIPPKTYGDAAFAVSANSVSTGAITYSVVSGPAAISGNTISITGAGTVSLQAAQAATTNYTSAMATASFTVSQETPTLAFASIPARTYGDAAFAVSANSNSTGAITYSVISGPATVSGNTVAITGAGTVSLQASQAATANYTASTATTSFAVSQATPTLAFTSIPAKVYGDAAFTVSASSASTGTITYSVVSGPATISGSTVTITGAGTVSLQAAQAATTNYTASTAATSFAVSQATPTLAFTSISVKTYGDATFSVSASSASNGAITYSVVSGPATISGSTVTITGAGTVNLQASQAATSNYAAATATTSFTVSPATPTLAFTSIPAKTYGDAAFTVSANSASNATITYSVVSGPATISGNTVTVTGAGTVNLQASQAATSNYTAATVTASFTVSQEAPTLSFALIPTKTYGDAAFTVYANSASNGTITYSVVSGPATISGSTATITGAGTVSLQAAQAATTNYTASTATTSFTVSQATPALIFATIPAKTYGDAAFSVSASSASSGAITYSVVSGPATISGNTVTITGAGTISLQAAQAATSNYTAAMATASFMVYEGAPSIITQPSSEKICRGGDASFSVVAQNASDYAWYTQGGTYTGSGSKLTISNITATNGGGYYCVASNAAGASVTSATAYLTVMGTTALSIKSQPESVSVYVTQAATFSVLVTATDTMSYQWYRNGSAISEATSSSYTTGALTASDNGSTYYVVVTDTTCGGTPLTSTAATLTVSSVDTAVPPTIIVQPQGQTASVGNTAEYTVVASGSGTLSYQWYRVPYSSTQATTAGTVISGAVGTMYTTSSVAQSNDGDVYFVRVTNAYGSAVSDRALLTVGSGVSLQISGQPQSQTISANTEADFSVTATCTGCIPAYQWYWYAPGKSSATKLTDGAVTNSSSTLLGAVMTGSATASLSIQNTPTTASGGVFYVVVTSTSDGSNQISGTHAITSNQAALFVDDSGTVGNDPAGGGLCNNSSNGTKWVLNGSNPGYTTSNIPYQNLSACTVLMTQIATYGGTSASGGYSSIFWPQLIPTTNFTVKLTVALSSGSIPADGFTMILADPTQGATASSLGGLGAGLGAGGIPGIVLGFDTYQDGNDNGGSQTYSCSSTNANGSCDPITVPYMAIGQGAAALWENPWTNVNGYLNTQSSSDYTPYTFANATHDYVIRSNNGVFTVTMDGYELFSGSVSMPPTAYLGFTASTGSFNESVTLSKMSVVVGTN